MYRRTFQSKLYILLLLLIFLLFSSSINRSFSPASMTLIPLYHRFDLSVSLLLFFCFVLFLNLKKKKRFYAYIAKAFFLIFFLPEVISKFHSKSHLIEGYA